MNLKEEYGYTLDEAVKLDEGKLLEVFEIELDRRKNLRNQILELIGLKECSKCSSILPLSRFYKNRSICKKCYNAPKVEYVEKEVIKYVDKEVPVKLNPNNITAEIEKYPEFFEANAELISAILLQKIGKFDYVYKGYDLKVIKTFLTVENADINGYVSSDFKKANPDLPELNWKSVHNKHLTLETLDKLIKDADK